MKKSLALLFSTIIALIALGGCAHYTKRPLNKLATGTPLHSKEKSISMATHVFTQGDCKRYLDRNVIAKGYQPIHITINNNSSRTFKIAKSDCSLPLVSSEFVARSVHTNTLGRALGYGIVGLFIWPFLIPAVVDSLGSDKANHQLDADYAGKILRDQTINPYSCVNGLIFVPCDAFDEDFTFAVVDADSGERLILSDSQPNIKL